jgi:hypothetical protein
MLDEEMLDNELPLQYLSATWGAFVVKRIGWIFVFLLITTVVFIFVVPLVDRPETSFNEIDTPVNQTTSSALEVRFAPPHESLIILPRSFSRPSEGIRTSIELISLAIHRHPSRLRELLCTFLI